MVENTPAPAVTELVEALRHADLQEDGTVIFHHSPEEIGLMVMESHDAFIIALSGQSPAPAPAPAPADLVEAVDLTQYAISVLAVVGIDYHTCGLMPEQLDAIMDIFCDAHTALQNAMVGDGIAQEDWDAACALLKAKGGVWDLGFHAFRSGVMDNDAIVQAFAAYRRAAAGGNAADPAMVEAVREVLNHAYYLLDDTANDNPPEVPQDSWDNLAKAVETLEGLIPDSEGPCIIGVAARLISATTPQPDPRDPEVKELRDALGEAKLQLTYLDERNPTGTTPAVITKINTALDNLEGK